MLVEKDEWIVAAKVALNLFIEIMGVEEWHIRRKRVVDYFNALNERVYDEATVQTTEEIGELFQPIAVYDDWMGWYMYLVESLVDRPICDDPVQSARIHPFFATIGRNIDGLKRIPGVEKRLKTLLNERQNKPDDTLFELVVAACYIRNGWTVRFLEERRGYSKTPDFEVSRAGETYPVECKRMSKTNDYAEKERREWQKRWRPLANAMRGLGLPVHVDITFKIPVEDVDIDALAKTYIKYIQSGLVRTSALLSTAGYDFEVKTIDISAITKQLKESNVRRNSPQLIKVITGSYDPNGSYTQLLAESEVYTFGNDDKLHVLNQFVGGLYTAYSAKWECIAEDAIDHKAKSITKPLSKAVSQMQDGVPGIIHIGYETVNGTLVEFRRHEKIVDAVQNFYYGSKNIEGIYCHAIGPLTKADGWECAETTSYFEKGPGKLLEDNLLLDPPGLETRDTTHWREDFMNDIS